MAPLKKEGTHVGIFGTWEMNLLETPADAFKRQLDRHPTYLFKEVEPNIYRLSFTSAKFYWGVIVSTLTVIVAVSMYAAASLDQYFTFHLVLFFWSLSFVLYYYKRRYIEVDHNKMTYRFYVEHQLQHEGPFHNVYIRLKGQKSGNGVMFFQVVVGGHQMDEQPLTQSSNVAESKLRKLARRLAARLHMNYFDYEDVSRHHIIRHRPNGDCCGNGFVDFQTQSAHC